jgi:hypothetical protein
MRDVAIRVRKAITRPDLVSVDGVQPLHDVDAIRGVRVHDVGQGDGITVYGAKDGIELPVLQLDYGGRERHPFKKKAMVDERMPMKKGQLLMLTHWDEDHWCSGEKGTWAKSAKWLVPRQLTSPRAVDFSAKLNDIRCIPESLVGEGRQFRALNGDSVRWEKIGAFPGAFAKDEDCNATGVALALVRRAYPEDLVILLPGDAPFDKVGIFHELARSGTRLRAIVAFHHGAGTHWTDATKRLIRDWPKTEAFDVVFSCSDPCSYHHPDDKRYKAFLPKSTRFHSTGKARVAKRRHIDIRFPSHIAPEA